MGNVNSRLGEGASSVYLRDQSRFSIAALTISTSHNRTLLSITPNEYPATRYTAKRKTGDETPVDYVLDPESSASSHTPSFLLRLSNDDELIFTFTFVLRQTFVSEAASGTVAAPPETIAAPPETIVNGLTFLYAPNLRDLDNLITKEIHADPNLHKNNPNVHLLGDYSTSDKTSIQFQWTWKWRPPKVSEDRGGGWRTSCSFVEYEQRNHRLNPLAMFTFWVQNTQKSLGDPKSAFPRLEVKAPAKLRVPSAQSIDSRVSDSDGAPETKESLSQSPTIEPIPEDGLGLVQTMTSFTAIANTAKVDVACQRPGEDVSAVEDGPLFRATMKAMEQRTGSMRARWKRVLRRAEEALLAQQSSNDAVAGLVSALRDASTSSSNAVKPAMEHYFDKIAKEILAYERQTTVNLQRMIIEPIAKLYNVDIKQAESKKRDFEEESNQYYAYVSKYLGQRQDSLKEKKRAETDYKYQKKRRDFELKRFDYSSFMQDLHGGRKDQEVLSNLTKFADTQARGFLTTAKRIDELLPQLEALTSEVKEADREFQLHRTEREEKRRALEKGNAFSEPDRAANQSSVVAVHSNGRGPLLDRSGSLQIKSGPTPTTPSSVMGTSVPASAPVSALHEPSANVLSSSPSQGNNKFKGIRDLEERDHSVAALDTKVGQQGKEGLVWALSRPGSHADPKGLNKQAWHKYWIVLDQGKLSEYTGWKEKLDLHMEPIDLRVASVREARNAERRFCFEIITPHFTRVYQAQGEEDVRVWIHAINNAMQNAVEGKGLPDATPRASSGSIDKNLASVLTGKSASTRDRSSYNHSKGVSRHATVGERPSYKAPTVEASESSQKLLRQIRETDAGNMYCADCDGESRVDWVSINLGIVICIECSGIHRSLGTHISKVRSLTLDPNAFTVDVVEILFTVGNRVSNMIWEARLDRNAKPSPQATRDQRLRFITAKYVDRAFVQPISATLSHYGTPDETLLASIKKNDMQNVLYALALKANPNVHDRSRNTHAVFVSLVNADPLSPAAASPGGSPNSTKIQTQPSQRKAFAIAELLILNGAEPPAQLPAVPLSPAAKQYLQSKQDQRNGRKSAKGLSQEDGGDSGVDTLTALPAFQSDDRTRKRISASGRLVKPAPTLGGS